MASRLVAAAAAASVGLGLFTAVPARAATNTLPVWTPLTLMNGWQTFSNASAEVSLVGGVVHFEGAIWAGNQPAAFVLPTAFRPNHTVYVPVTFCNAANGRLIITHDGLVQVQAETDFSKAQCATWLDGVTFSKNATGYTALTLLNGWTSYGYDTRGAAVKIISGVVQFEGAIATAATSNFAFTLPAGFAPSSVVYVPVDLCNATNGQLVIDTSGNVTVQAETNFSNAQCFTSLEGASFSLNAKGYTGLGLQNGWTNAPNSTRNAAVKIINGIVHFEGAIASGTFVAFTLPPAFIPTHSVVAKVDLCGAASGVISIYGDGEVVVYPDNSSAQCFTSLEGVSYAL